MLYILVLLIYIYIIYSGYCTLGVNHCIWGNDLFDGGLCSLGDFILV